MKQKLGPLQLALVETLEEGRIPQGSGWLCREPERGRYCECCVLCVACLVYEANVGKLQWELIGRVWVIDGYAGICPDSVIYALKIANPNHWAAMNDTGTTFAEFAHLMRANPAKFFTEEA